MLQSGDRFCYLRDEFGCLSEVWFF